MRERERERERGRVYESMWMLYKCGDETREKREEAREIKAAKGNLTVVTTETSCAFATRRERERKRKKKRERKESEAEWERKNSEEQWGWGWREREREKKAEWDLIFDLFEAKFFCWLVSSLSLFGLSWPQYFNVLSRYFSLIWHNVLLSFCVSGSLLLSDVSLAQSTSLFLHVFLCGSCMHTRDYIGTRTYNMHTRKTGEEEGWAKVEERQRWREEEEEKKKKKKKKRKRVERCTLSISEPGASFFPLALSTPGISTLHAINFTAFSCFTSSSTSIRSTTTVSRYFTGTCTCKKGRRRSRCSRRRRYGCRWWRW